MTMSIGIFDTPPPSVLSKDNNFDDGFHSCKRNSNWIRYVFSREKHQVLDSWNSFAVRDTFGDRIQHRHCGSIAENPQTGRMR